MSTKTTDLSTGGLSRVTFRARVRDVHPLLKSNAFGWDIAWPPTPANVQLLFQQGASALYLADPATSPPTTVLDIGVSSLLFLWNPIKIASPRIISVDKVFSAIFAHIQKPVREAEWATLNREDQGKVSRTFYARLLLLEGDERKKEMAKGLKRMDFLGRPRLFSIVPSNTEQYDCVLYLR